MTVGVALAAITASGCGGPSAAQKRAKAQLADYRTCKAKTSRFLAALHDLDSRLDVGLNVDDYGNRVGDVKVTHDAVAFRQLPYSCRKKVEVPAEGALGSYSAANTVWHHCLTKYGDWCFTNDPTTKNLLEILWNGAHKEIRKAQSGLHRLAAGA